MTHRRLKSELVKLGRAINLIRDDRIQKMAWELSVGRKLDWQGDWSSLFAAYKRGVKSTSPMWLVDTNTAFFQCGHYPHWELAFAPEKVRGSDVRGPFAPEDAQAWASRWNKTSSQDWIDFLNL